MKKVIVATMIAVVACVGLVVAGTVTNQMGIVITTSTDAYGVTTTTMTLPNAASSVTNRTVSPVGAQLDAGDNTNPTLFTPRNYCDFLVGKEGGTGKVWVAAALTTNDWKAIYDP